MGVGRGGDDQMVVLNPVGTYPLPRADPIARLRIGHQVADELNLRCREDTTFERRDRREEGLAASRVHGVHSRSVVRGISS